LRCSHCWLPPAPALLFPQFAKRRRRSSPLASSAGLRPPPVRDGKRQITKQHNNSQSSLTPESNCSCKGESCPQLAFSRPTFKVMLARWQVFNTVHDGGRDG
jgi:hypothetical protein